MSATSAAAAAASISLPIPNGLSDTLPHPQSPWKVNFNLFNRVKSQLLNSSKPFSTCEVLNTDPEFSFILKYFENQRPPGYGIRRIVCIHNPAQTGSFESAIKTIDQEANNPIFSPKWNAEDLALERTQVIRRWQSLTDQFSPVEIVRTDRIDEYTKVSVLPLWHGSRDRKSVV